MALFIREGRLDERLEYLDGGGFILVDRTEAQDVRPDVGTRLLCIVIA